MADDSKTAAMQLATDDNPGGAPVTRARAAERLERMLGADVIAARDRRISQYTEAIARDIVGREDAERDALMAPTRATGDNNLTAIQRAQLAGKIAAEHPELFTSRDERLRRAREVALEALAVARPWLVSHLVEAGASVQGSGR